MPASAVTEAGDVPDEHLAGPELVAVRAARQRLRHPRARRGVDQIPDATHPRHGAIVGVDDELGQSVLCVPFLVPSLKRRLQLAEAEGRERHAHRKTTHQ
jgi:hypothetical protein